MEKYGGIPGLFLLIDKRHGFLFQIRPREHGNLLKVLLRIRLLLPFVKLLRFLHNLPDFLIGEPFPVGFQLLRKGSFPSGGKTGHRTHRENGLVGIFQHEVQNQLLKISCVNGILKLLKGFIGLNMHERRSVIVKPAVKSLQPQKKSPGIRAEVRLPVFKFKVVDCSRKRLFVKPLLHRLMKHFFNSLYKFFFLAFPGIPGNYGKIRLVNAVFHGAVYVLANPFVNQCLLYQRPRRGAENIIQHIHGNIKLFVKAGSHGNIIGQIGIILRRFILHHRVLPQKLFRFIKRLLHSHLRIHLKGIVAGEVFPVQEVKIFLRVQVSVQINIAV